MKIPISECEFKLCEKTLETDLRLKSASVNYDSIIALCMIDVHRYKVPYNMKELGRFNILQRLN